MEKVSTLTQGFPEEYDMFLVISPQMDFTAEEIEALDAYLKKAKAFRFTLILRYRVCPGLKAICRIWEYRYKTMWFLKVMQKELHIIHPCALFRD